ncbi:prepilin-type N-terminal cleavage/methylation domain-containing protein [Lactiplantibacillus garii]|uniref:Prepilin-type N-terminal cleavage/methylation domain-containing protein n=1 Tax=Lactiplantibacillus garii TaxID=2306423 RepID=A0A3R8QPN0_9LACO|nr:prepilin-type N-terminal cleavage/methylation domain-containing protein [Lactiplantibacillus garii]RRK09544.1 prepilin-type N-terminal cleavage/methylation domain-containing protein [Lactiplantibacillus garii]
MQRRNNGRLGFTLIETVVVLGLLGTLLVIGVERFPTRQRQLNDEKMFWQRLDILWKEQALIASTTGIQQVVNFSPFWREVVFVTNQKQHASRTTRLPLPKTMTIQGKETIPIYKNGHPQPATVIFRSQLRPHQKQKFRVLMGWGEYQVDTE